MTLVMHGVPWSEAVSWSPARRFAACVVIGENKGGRFNWNRMTMEWPKATP